MLMMKFQFHSNRNDLEDCCKQTMGNLEKLKAKFDIDLQVDSLRNKVSLNFGGGSESLFSCWKKAEVIAIDHTRHDLPPLNHTSRDFRIQHNS